MEAIRKFNFKSITKLFKGSLVFKSVIKSMANYPIDVVKHKEQKSLHALFESVISKIKTLESLTGNKCVYINFICQYSDCFDWKAISPGRLRYLVVDNHSNIYIITTNGVYEGIHNISFWLGEKQLLSMIDDLQNGKFQFIVINRKNKVIKDIITENLSMIESSKFNHQTHQDRQAIFERVNFIKFLVNKYPDTSIEVNEGLEFEHLLQQIA